MKLIKVDVQDKGLQVLTSAGNLITRARQVCAEVFLKPAYKGKDGVRPGMEKEFIDDTKTKGFKLLRRLEVYTNKGQKDLMFVNTNWKK